MGWVARELGIPFLRLAGPCPRAKETSTGTYTRWILPRLTSQDGRGQTTLSPHTAMYVGTAALGQDGHDMLLVAGGKNVKLEEGLLVLRENRIEPLRTNNASFPEPHRSMQTYPYAGAFVKDTGHEDGYYLLGGFFRRDDMPNDTFKDVVLKYSAQSNSWEDMGATNGPRRYHYTATLYRDSIYLVGGMSADTDRIMPLTSVWRYDISRRFWEEKKCGGAVLGGRALHSSVLIGSRLHVVGGANQEVVSGQVDVLDLSTLVWETIKVEGLHGKSQGCLVHYKNQLIYSFGYSAPFKQETQLIDLDSMEIIKASEPIPHSLVIAAVLAVLFAILLFMTLLLFWYHRYKLNLKQCEDYRRQYEEHLRTLSIESPHDVTSIQSGLTLTNHMPYNFDTKLHLPTIDQRFSIQEPPPAQCN
ncbi:hypothetical protein DSO57_1016900 [Entomophthora muscae]|uniref:Uncharacterized protein n=1 Tax=Entomophthora muscae TaxID=34485 RepID=A0ACC2T4L7_9FUNG|nr:hypothetical protein DSO57_1016900 [Entomophthora muscae]